ncbi:MAG TPA: tetratricopeptide repeat protein, partial [Burkholderiaceae bacterium]
MRRKVIHAAVHLALTAWGGAQAAEGTPQLELKLTRELLLRPATRAAQTAVAAPAPAAATAQASSVDRASLLSQARLWESRNRDDLAMEAIVKLLRVHPDDPDALARLALLQLRTNQKEQMRTSVERLRRIRPDHDTLPRLEALQRLEEIDKDKLRQIRMLAKARRVDEAVAGMRALFPNGPPSGDIALEYWNLVADTDNGWEPANQGLSALVRDNPDNLRYRLALANHHLTRKPADAAALKLVMQLALDPKLEKSARYVWRRAMLNLPAQPASVPLIERYLAQEKEQDLTVIQHLGTIRASIERERKLLADPAYRARLDGLALLEKGKEEQAGERLEAALAGRPDDPEVLGGLGVLRMRQGHHAEAQGYFLQAQKLDADGVERWSGLARTAHYWGLLREAGDASSAGEYALAESKLREAMTIDSKQAAAMVALGRIYASQNMLAEAEQTYRAALARSANDFGALRALATLYVQTAREEKAQQTLARFTPQQKKELGNELFVLRASMLQNKAEEVLARGRTDVAIMLLDRAAAYDPDNAHSVVYMWG